MKVEIINKPMLCWDIDEEDAKEWHVLAKVTECDSSYPFKVISNENTYPPGENRTGELGWFNYAKPISEVTEMTVAEISKALGKTIKIVE